MFQQEICCYFDNLISSKQLINKMFITLIQLKILIGNIYTNFKINVMTIKYFLIKSKNFTNTFLINLS